MIEHGDGRGALVSAGTAAAVVAGTALASPGRWTDPSWLAVAAICALLALRRRYPVVTAWATMLACGVYYPFSRLDGPVILVFVLALYTVAETGRTLAPLLLLAVSIAGAWVGEALSTSHPLGPVGVFMLSGWLVAVVALGVARHERAERLAALEENARHRVTEERLRIARDVHDVVGHSLSVINVQASAALHRLDDDPGLARPALENIKSTGKQALAELRGTLHALRPPAAALPFPLPGAPPPDPAPPAPGPGLALLDELVRAGSLGGTAVQVRWRGTPRPLPPDVDLAAYRVVQEALTNVRRHAAGATTAEVRISYGSGDLAVQVDDDGPGTVPSPDPPSDPPTDRTALPGHGLRGLTERARSLGGELVAGPRPGGGYRVTARFPA